MDDFYIRPAVVGARLPDPATGDLLKAEGDWKPRNHHWLRAELRGDIEECDPPKPEAAATEEPAPMAPETPAPSAEQPADPQVPVPSTAPEPAAPAAPVIEHPDVTAIPAGGPEPMDPSKPPEPASA